MKQNPRNLMLVFRAIYLALMGYCVLTGRLELALQFSIPFLITLFIPYLAQKEKAYYWVDILFSLLFIVSLSVSYFESWPRQLSWTSTDKIFHFMGGACLGSLAWVFYKARIENKIVLWVTVLLATLAIGAGWEVFEWMLSLLPQHLLIPSTGYEDTMMDLIVDSFGGLASLVLLEKFAR